LWWCYTIGNQINLVRSFFHTTIPESCEKRKLWPTTLQGLGTWLHAWRCLRPTKHHLLSLLGKGHAGTLFCVPLHVEQVMLPLGLRRVCGPRHRQTRWSSRDSGGCLEIEGVQFRIDCRVQACAKKIVYSSFMAIARNEEKKHANVR
jgi:hypothetical protein